MEVAGVALLVAGLLWRTMADRRARNRLANQLRSPDPARRIDAAIALVHRGLDQSAPELIHLLKRETDPAVKIAIAEAVAERQWEPGGRAPINEIRSWAHNELSKEGRGVDKFAPAVTRISDMGGPRLPASMSRPPVETNDQWVLGHEQQVLEAFAAEILWSARGAGSARAVAIELPEMLVLISGPVPVGPPERVVARTGQLFALLASHLGTPFDVGTYRMSVEALPQRPTGPAPQAAPAAPAAAAPPAPPVARAMPPVSSGPA
jgi:hypothetical protein